MDQVSFDFARPEDYPALSLMWQTNFRQTPEDALFFLKNRYRPGELILLRDEFERPVSMMTLIPARLNNLPGTYLYGMATRADRQGEGLMHRLHREALAYLAQQGVRYTCLAPSNGHQFALYRDLGYEIRFYRSERRFYSFTPCPFLDLYTPGEVDFTLMRSQYLQKEPYRLRLMCPDFILQELRHFGGDAVCFTRRDETGYAAYTLEGQTLHIRELSVPFTPELGASLLAYTGCRYILLDEPRPGIPVGMYRPIAKDPFPSDFAGTMSLCLER